jgi:acyl-CoA dehydrogenase
MGRAQPWVSGASELDPALLSAVRAFSRRHQDAVTLDRAGLLPVSLLDDARALGLFGLAIPVRFGGLGLGLGPTAAVVAELARADRSVATTVGLHNGLGSRALLAGADPGLLERYAPQLANGTRVGAFAATEPGAGSDLGAIRTTTRRDSAGLRISGEKAYVTNAGFAGLFTVLCRTPDGEGAHSSALVVVPGEAPGVSLGREELKMGLRASSTRALHLDDVWVPNDHRLGASERGTVEAHRALEWGRSLMAAGCLGTAKEALARTLAYASERTQFRRRLRAFGAVRSHLVVMATSVVTLEALLSRVAGDEQCGLPLESSSAALKVMASELAFDAADRAVQVHGALGFVEDAGIALLQRDARVTRIFEGANDVLLVRLGSALLAGKGLPLPGVPEAETSAACARLVGTVHAFRRAHGVQAVSHQPLLIALARADVALYAAHACLCHARQHVEVEAVAIQASRRLVARALTSLDEACTAVPDEAGDEALLDCLGDDARALLDPYRLQ